MRNRKIIKRKKKKGFTLIELLAVILILGIIALIAIPTVNNVIKEARKGAFKSTVNNVIIAIEQQCQVEQLRGDSHTNSYVFSTDGVTPDLQIKGSLPTDGIINVDDSCNVEVNVSNDDYTAIKDKDSDVVLIVDKEDNTNVGQFVDSLLSKSSTYTYMGGTYLKGKQPSNYVWYSGNLYRIMGKDENGNVRLISEGNVTAIPINDGNTVGANAFVNSYAKEWLNDYFYNHLSNPSLLQNTSYCTDVTDDTFSMRQTCSSSKIDSKVTLISLDEYRLAMEPTTYACDDIGLRFYRSFYWNHTAKMSDFQTYLSNNNMTCMTYVKNATADIISVGSILTYDDEKEEVDFSDSYLMDLEKNLFLTLTPNSLEDNSLWMATYYGSNGSSIEYTFNGLRPIITISSDVAITSGNGSESQPIMIEELETSGRLIDKVVSGEYVTIEGNRYRVIETIEGVGTKLALDGYLDVDDSYITMMTKMRNNSYLTNLGLSTTDSRLVNYTWDRGNYLGYTDKYTVSLASSSNTFTSYVGGVRVGEMYSSQSHSIILEHKKEYWMLTLSDSTVAWVISAQGYSYDDETDYDGYVRPAIVIAPSVNISGGNGTLTNPYKI